MTDDIERMARPAYEINLNIYCDDQPMRAAADGLKNAIRLTQDEWSARALNGYTPARRSLQRRFGDWLVRLGETLGGRSEW